MQIYSSFYSQFINRVKKLASEVLNQEMGLAFKKTRFKFNGYTYPVNFIVFEGRELGYFQPDKWQIAINKRFSFESDESLKILLRHELAHLYNFIINGSNVSDHGQEFRNICKNFGWGEEVYSSKMHLPDKEVSDSQSKSNIAKKIQKLLSLSLSDNIHESQAATEKAQALAEKFQIHRYENGGKELEYFVKPILKFSRKTAKYQCISEILEVFHVNPVFNYGKRVVYLEVIGSREAVEIAEYIASYLDNSLEELWKKGKKEFNLKSKSSFFYGLSYGYTKKIQNRERQAKDLKTLTLISTHLTEVSHKVYGGLSQKQSKFILDRHSLSEGKKAGNRFEIRKGLSEKSTNGTIQLLT